MKCVISILAILGMVLSYSQARPIVEEKFELVDGDMLMTKEQKIEYQELKSGRVRRAAVRDARLWPNGRVPYTFGNALNNSEDARARATEAMQNWMDNTCIEFVKRTNETAYVEFQLDGKCRAAVGYGNTARRKISLGSANNLCSLGSSIHEIGHAIGFYHEHVRPDRDDFVTFNESNMIPGVGRNFQLKTEAEVDSRGHAYDLDSIMHYSRLQGSRNGHPVLIPKEPNQNAAIGQRNGLSEGDIAQANTMYQCDENDQSHFNMDESKGSGKGSPEKEIEIME